MISGSSDFSKTSLNIWEFLVHILLKPSLKNFPGFVVIHIVRGFLIVNEGELDAFLKFPCFLYDPTDVDNLTSGSSALSKLSLYIWKFSGSQMFNPSLAGFEHYPASM